jgi:hypothetical protein
MEELRWSRNSFDIPHDFFKKVCDFTIPKRASMQWEWFFYQKRKTKLIFARRL